jgi:hypothetical protein
MNTTKVVTYALIDDGPIEKAISRVLELVGAKTADQPTDNCDLLVMADGSIEADNEALSKILSIKSAEELSLLYLETTSENRNRNPFGFLAEIIPTYRIPLENFSITELAKVVGDIHDNNRHSPRTNPLVKKREDIIAAIQSTPNSDFQELSDYLRNQGRFIERAMHDVKQKDAQYFARKEDIKAKIVALDYCASLLKIPKDISINVLIVENNPDEISKELVTLNSYFTGIRFFLIKGKDKDKDKFKEFRDKLHREVDVELSEYIDQERNSPFVTDSKIKFSEIDFILQDIFLGDNGMSGTDLAPLYCNVAPQAILFFLTSMDVETLAASGYSDKVDRVISKDRIPALMKYYYERFHELYGPLLWPVFLESEERKENPPTLLDRESVRHLLANVRLWIMEPGILFHGYALPEMVDHEMRHTVGLWNMTNRILGPYLERRPEGTMSHEERVLLALAIWLHDIGHRGDEHHTESMAIREHHGSISESLILGSPEALGIDWLLELCDNKCNKPCNGDNEKKNERLVNRNKKEACNESTQICPLRIVGLLCRYHQSNAPLTANHLIDQINKMKFPSPYCVVAINEDGSDLGGNYQEQIDKWLDQKENFDWFSTDVRVLSDFETDGISLYNLVGLLSWLDAVHTHSERVGTQLQIRSFMAYNKMRKKFCDKRIAEVEEVLAQSTAGSEAYLGLLAERAQLDQYDALLDKQTIHLWRSGMVNDIRGEWCGWLFRVIFYLKQSDPLEPLKELFNDNLEYQNALTGDVIWEKWSYHVFAEVIEEELKRQAFDPISGKLITSPKGFLHYFGNDPLTYYYTYTVAEKKVKYEMEKVT